METPSAKYFCPKCKSCFEINIPFCGQCGADMRVASRLDLAVALEHTETENPEGLSKCPPPRGTVTSRRGTDPWLGRVVDGRYEVEEVLGRGGMGVVYKIKHRRMGKVAAMKVLHKELAQKPEVVARFETEAQAVSRLGHPNTVQVFDFGTENGALYLVMEYVRGLDLGAIIDRDGPMGFEEAAPLLVQICSSLEEAHDMGVIHRDLKPDNLLVSRTHSGRDFIKVLDFGLAKLSEQEDASSVTSAGSIVGTPYYMSPEQIRAEEVDHRVDIYSFGAMMYRVLTADNAYNAKTPVGVLTKHLTDVFEPPSHRYPELQLSPVVDDVIAKCMAKKPSDRYQSAKALREVIEKLYGELAKDRSDFLGVPGTQSGRVRVADVLVEDIDHGMKSDMRLQRGDLDLYEKQIKRRRNLQLLVAPTLVLALIGAVVYWTALRSEQPHSREIESNNEFAEATLIAPNTTVVGYIGKRMDPYTADRDFYQLATAPKADGSQVVTVSVTGLPNIDISLDLYDSNGVLLKHSDEGKQTFGERITRWRADRGVVVAVKGVLSKGALPVENVSDSYELKVVFAPVDPRRESEPNDSGPDANTLVVGTPITGTLGSEADLDMFRVSTAAGKYKLLISGGPDVPFEWRLDGEKKWRSTLKASVSLASNNTISMRLRPGVKFTGEANPYTIDIRPAL